MVGPQIITEGVEDLGMRLTESVIPTWVKATFLFFAVLVEP